MTAYAELITRIRDRTGIETNDEAERAARTVVDAVAGQLPDRGAREELATYLPARLRDAAYPQQSPDDAAQSAQSTQPAEFVTVVAERLGWQHERARYVIQGVFSALGDDQPQLMGRVRQWMPGALGEQAGSMAPVADTAPDTGRQLTEEEVASELSTLAGWTGNAHRIHRTVSLPPEWVQPLIEQVLRASSESRQHVDVAQGPDEVTFTLYTDSVGAVTADDLAFARSIDQIVFSAPYVSS